MTFKKPCHGYITSLFQKARLDPVEQKVVRPHRGTDYGNHRDNTIIAAADGTVTKARTAETDGFGKVVFVVHNIGGVVYETVYAHLSSISVKVGQVVKQGQKIGVKGTTGNSTGVHLHFEICKGQWNKEYTGNVNPTHYIDDPDVRRLQLMLNKLGYKVTVDGLYGDGMIKAVTAYQQANNLKADGVAGNVTMASIEKTAQPVQVAMSANPIIKPEVEEIYLKLSSAQKAELANVYKHAREKGVFSSAEHEADVKADKMTHDKAIFLNGLIAGAALNDGVRIK